MSQFAIVISNSILQDNEIYLLNDCICQICYESINNSNYITYQLSPDLPWCLTKSICSDCLDDYIDNQNQKMKYFVKEFSNLNHCSKMLKHLLKGEYGIPINLQDTVIFPLINDKSIFNLIDPQFGRKNEVYQLSIGMNGIKKDPHLANSPKTSQEVRKLLLEIVNNVRQNLLDYDVSDTIELTNDCDVEEIKNYLSELEIILK